MALTPQEQRRVRNAVELISNRKGVSQHWSKTQINAAVESLDDRWDAVATQTVLSSGIEAAAPGVFTNPEKKYITAFWLILRGERERELI